MSTVWVVLETASALVALLAALLVIGRYRTSSMLRDLALVQAFVVLAVANLLPNVLPALVDREAEASVLRLRLQLVCGVLAAAAFVSASVAGDVKVARRYRAPVVALATAFLVPAVGVVALEASGVDDAIGVGPRVLKGVAGILFAVAALGFRTESRRLDQRDDLRRSLTVGMLLAATARLIYVVDPAPLVVSAASPRLGDFARFGFYAVLLTGAVREIRSYWQRMAVHEERQRLARDLHDGVAQELAFIATEAARQRPKPDQLEQIAAAAGRALDESRRAISALSRPLAQPLDEAVAEAAEEVAGRSGVRVRLDLASGVEVSPGVREELVRILREAVGNAARHSQAASIDVQLRKEDRRIRLRVVDDGRGFVPTETSGRFGIASMTQRASAIGGALSIATEPGAGTTVEVDLPVPSRS